MKKTLLFTLVLGTTQALAVPTIDTGADGVLTGFEGIDWHSNGAGWVRDFGLTTSNNEGDSDDFTLTYQAFAGTIDADQTTPNLRVATPGPGVGTYEFTTFAEVSLNATCVEDGCANIDITLNSGTWEIFYDDSPDASTSTGIGFLDGDLVMSGTWDSGAIGFTYTDFLPVGMGTGGALLSGTVNFTDTSRIKPVMVGSGIQASLQFPGEAFPHYTRSAAFNGESTGIDTASSFVIQTDTSQRFEPVQVPNPGTMLLMDLGLFGFVVNRAMSN